MIRTLYGWRGVRIGEASNPGPLSNVCRVPRTSQQSGASTVPTDSREVRGVLRGVPGNDPTVADTRSGNRFAPLSEPSGVEHEGRRGVRRRRLVLISQQEVPESDHERDSDTDSTGGASDVEGVDVVAETPVEDPIILEWRLRAPVRSFASLDAVNLSELFESRPRLTRSVPHVLRGGVRSALRVAFQETLAGVDANSEGRTVRGWKLLSVTTKNAALQATSRRHSSSQEVGGQAQAVPGR